MQQTQFYLHSSNSLEDLAMDLSQRIAGSRLPVFEPVYIVTQTEGMNAWLKLQLATHLDIAANIEFLKPNELVNRVYARLGGRFSRALSASNIVWLVFKILGQKEFTERFPAVASYFSSAGAENPVKRMSLAEKVADLFDQYQVYRPDMIARWNEGALHTRFAEEEWQQTIWLAARAEAGDLLPDRTKAKTYIERELQDPAAAGQLQEGMSAIYLFGISLITEYHLELLHSIAKVIPVHFFILNPAPSLYWYEDKSEKAVAFLKRRGIFGKEETSVANPLLTNWGKVIQDTFLSLFESDEVINSYDVISETVFQPYSLLHKIQHALAGNLPQTQAPVTQGDLEDGSVYISASYSAFREVEALYNYLVHLVDKRGESLSPRDIVVMVSDIEAYGSYIRAIFDHAPFQFKYTIADEAYTNTDSVFHAMISLLEMGAGQFTAEQVYRLLDFSCIRRKTGIVDVDLIRQVIDEANIRFGIRGNLTDESLYVSWKYGLNRMMYGICMAGGEEYGEGETSFYPLDTVEGSESLDVIRFVHFAQTLIEWIETRRMSRDLAGWAAYLEDIFHLVLFTPESSGEEEALLLRQIQNLRNTGELFTDELPYDVFAHQFIPTLQTVNQSGAFGSGGITFCSLIPMRSIPFKVVALLGMDFDKLPRKNKPVTFNLIEKEHRRGDRNIKQNDKHLLLETLLSAGKYLYISYIGQNIKDNSPLPASILIDELIDFIEISAEDPSAVRNTLIRYQPLHSFGKARDAAIPNYLLAAGKPPISLKQKTETPQPLPETDMADLIAFFKNPVRFYYNKRLEIFYANEEVTLPETEIFETNHLENHLLKKQVLVQGLEKIDDLREQMVKTGRLPLKNMARIILDGAAEEIAPLRPLWEGLTKNLECGRREIYLLVGDDVITGTLDDIYGERVVVVSLSKYELKYFVEAYLKHLIVSALGWNLRVCVLSAQKQKVFEAAETDQSVAIASLARLLALMQAGSTTAIPFTLDVNTKPKDWEQYTAANFYSDLKKLLEGNYCCPYLQREWAFGTFQAQEAFEQYQSVAEQILYKLPATFQAYFHDEA